MQTEFAAVPFKDATKAEANLTRLEQQLAAGLRVPLASLLSVSPDPDGALNLLERYAQVAPPEILQDLARTPTALSYLVAIFGYSGFLAETFLTEPSLAIQFARDRNFTKLKSKEDLMQDYARFSITNPDPWLSSQLARFKRRNYLRLVLKDVLGLSTLGETTLELSALTDVILANALLFCDRELEKRYGQPQYRDVQGRIVRAGFSVVSLGKLGGNELNYSSDIDLLFLYSHDGETAGSSERHSVISNKEYFVHLAHAMTRTITQITPQGQVFRVDLRLRPEGDQGDLAISIKSALEYYDHRAREWELQMLIKARHSAGDPRLTREFLRSVEPYIYGSATDFDAVESVLWAREKMKTGEARGNAIDVKRHRGGIRDIEFLTQCLQRLHGGQDPWVRSGGTLLALRKLNDKVWLSDGDYAALTSAYGFLRKVEHRIQLDLGQQTHRLPVEPAALDRLARRAGVEGRGGECPGEGLQRRLQEGFRRVEDIYRRVIHPHVDPASEAAFELRPLTSPRLDHGIHSSESIRVCLDAQAPELAGVLQDAALPDRAQRSATRFLSAILGSSERFRIAREHPHLVRRALEVVARSEHLADLLIRHPEDIVLLDSALSACPLDTAGEQREIGFDISVEPEPFSWVTEERLGVREKMAVLRQQYRERVLALGAADLLGGRSIFSALARWSLLARKSVLSALPIAQEALGRRSTASAPPPFMVLGLGRLGFSEFDLASDADLVFVAASGTPRDEIAHWTRVAEKLIEVLSSYTREGTLFAVDTRLRPQGQEGELVVTEDALLDYLGTAAQAWEALTYLKASPVAGDLERARRLVSRLVVDLLERFGSSPSLSGELREMRRRLEREVATSRPNTKTASGGYYDVDFAVSLLQFRHRLAIPPGRNIAERAQALQSASLISSEDAATLTEGAAFLRSADHALRLITGRASDALPERVGHAEAVEATMRRWGLVSEGVSLSESLRRIQQRVRDVHRRIVGTE